MRTEVRGKKRVLGEEGREREREREEGRGPMV